MGMRFIYVPMIYRKTEIVVVSWMVELFVIMDVENGGQFVSVWDTIVFMIIVSTMRWNWFILVIS